MLSQSYLDLNFKLLPLIDFEQKHDESSLQFSIKVRPSIFGNNLAPVPKSRQCVVKYVNAIRGVIKKLSADMLR